MACNPYLKFLRKGVAYWNRWKKKNPGTKMFLQDVDFSGADLSGIDFENCFLHGKFNGTNFEGANLKGAIIVGFSEFTEAKFVRVDFSKANFGYGIVTRPVRGFFEPWAETRIPSDLTNAKFNDAVLFETNLRYQCLEGADFEGAQLNYAILSNARLAGANFSETSTSYHKCVTLKV